MKRDARCLALTAMLLGLVFGGRAAEADLLTPVDSSFALMVQAQVGYSPMVTDTSSQSQGSTLNPLTVAVSAYSSSNLASLLVTANGSASWTSASTGEVTFWTLAGPGCKPTA